MRFLREISALGAVAVLVLSCEKDWDERPVHEGTGLGFPEKVMTLEADGGRVVVPVIATQGYDIHSEAEWLDLPASGPAGRDGFTALFLENRSFPRSAKVTVSIGDHRDTLLLRQKGKTEPVLDAPTHVISVRGSAAGSVEAEIRTNLPDEVLDISWYTDGDSEWISNVSLQDGKLCFDYQANPLSHTRRGGIDIRYEGAFGDELLLPVQLCQLSSEDSAGAQLSLPQLCALATEDGARIENDTVIEGIVVSDKENGNCGDNEQLSVTTIDYSLCRRTLYLEALDGSSGICIIAARESDNVFRQGDRVKLSVRGATLKKSRVLDPQMTPVYYTLSGFRGNMALECEHLGRAGIPVKEKYIGALSDEDIFTYVTIKDCELPVRKGPLTPVSEQFTSVGGADKVSKFGILLHDICGGSMYLYTNTTCPYRRDGSILPQGSGKLSGVVVHELYPRFSYQDNASADPETWGTVGRYQLRHTCKEDFQLAPMMADRSFSEIICEWRYILDKNLERYYATDGDKTAYFDYSYVYENKEPWSSDGRAGKAPINKRIDYSYLGPQGRGNGSGLGVILDDGTDWMSPAFDGYNSACVSSINAKGYGEVPADAGSAWSTNLTVRGGKPQYTTLVFSTAGRSGSKMSMQICSMNDFYTASAQTSLKIYLEGPRYWWVEYSLDGSSWTPVAKYSLPEFCQTSPMTQLWQTAGCKPVNIPLPAAELLGREKVWIRIIPDSALLTGSTTAYLDPSIVYPAEGSFPTVWNYIGIRYNKIDPPSTAFDGGSGIDPMTPIDYNW